MIMNYGEFSNREDATVEALPASTPTETLAQYLERGGKITKVATQPIIWRYTVSSTGKRGSKMVSRVTNNSEQD